MANFFAFIFFGSIIGLIVGMFKPKAVVRWKEEASRKDVFKIYLSLVLVSLVAIGIFAPKVENKNNGTKEEVSTTAKEKQPTVDEDYENDKQEVLKLLNMSYHDLFQVEKDFSYFQKNIDSDIYTAISSAKRNEPKVMKLTYKSYPDDFEDSKTEDIVEKYIETLHNSNLFLQMAYNNFLDYVDNKKPTLVVKIKENIQYYQTSKMQAISSAFTLGEKYKLAYDEMTETWREKKFIEEDKKELQAKQDNLKQTKPFINMKDFDLNTPKYIIAGFITTWQYKDFKEMVQYTQKSWRDRENSPAGYLLNSFEYKTLIDAKIENIEKRTDDFYVATISIKYKNSFNNKETIAKITPTIIKEDGKFGFNPISAIREQ
jgi:hypothetical protein